jgi:hypothetical protein
LDFILRNVRRLLRSNILLRVWYDLICRKQRMLLLKDIAVVVATTVLIALQDPYLLNSDQ